MIVISGALVLVALVLLVLGLTMGADGLPFVYASILVSLVSFGFLLIGILQRRREQPSSAGSPAPEVRSDEQVDDGPSDEPAPAPRAAKAGRAGSVPVQAQAAVVDDEQDEDEDEAYDDEELIEGGGAVLVVPGRPRYHVDGCRYLSGKTAEEIDVLDAREDGFTACGVCKPDEALDELYGPEEPAEDEQFEDDEEFEDEEPDEPEPARAPAARGRAAKATSTRAMTQPARGRGTQPAGRGSTRLPTVPPVDVSTLSPPRAAKSARSAPARTAATKRAPARAGSAPQKSAPSSRGRVVVIPDRGRFHLSDCRFVRAAGDTQELSRAQAAKQGYAACGVCKP